MSRPYSGFLSASGVSGQEQLIGDYTGASPTVCRLEDDLELLSESRLIRRLVIYARSGNNLRSDYYAGVDLQATPGIVLRVWDTRQEIQTKLITCMLPVKRFSEWDAHCFDGLTNDFGVGDSSEVARWSFWKDYNTDDGGFILKPFERLEALLHADFSGLTGHTIKMLGSLNF